MAQYINKDALVAEINNCIDRCTIKKQSCPVNTQVEAICNNKIYAYKEILSFIDTLASLQEEPAPKILEDMLNAKTAAESLGISQEEHDKIIDLCLYGSEVELVDVDDLPNKEEEPVSEELEEAAIEICSKVLKGETITIDGYEYVVLSDAEECFKAGAKWQKEYIMKEIKIRLVDAATNQDNSTAVAEQTYYNGMVDALGRLRDKFMED